VPETELEGKMVFGVSPEGQGDGAPVVLLGIPAAAWEYMKDGKTHTFDLTRVGIPVKLVLYGAKDHATAMEYIRGHIFEGAEPGGKNILLDQRSVDFSIAPKFKTCPECNGDAGTAKGHVGGVLHFCEHCGSTGVVPV
jgi:hypothetical protein